MGMLLRRHYAARGVKVMDGEGNAVPAPAPVVEPVVAESAPTAEPAPTEETETEDKKKKTKK